MRFVYFLIISFTCILCPIANAMDISPSAPVLPADASNLQAETGNLSTRFRIFVKRFRITGNSRFSEEELAVVTAPYMNREITFEELQSLRQGLTQYYIDKGYINSGVIIPDQQVVDGTVTLNVIEGSVTSIDVEGNKYFRSFYIKNRLSLASSTPVNINNIQKALQLLQQDPRIRRINAEMSPGVVPGEAVLKIKVEEEKPYRVALTAGNNQSPSVGSYRGEILLAHQNLFGLGDILEGRFGITEGTDDIFLSYLVPVTARDTTVKVYYRKSESTVIEETFKRLDIESISKTLGLTISHPFYKTPGREFTLSLTGEIRRNATFLLGIPFSFSDIDDSVTHVTALRFSQDWISRSQTEVIALRSNFSLGIDAFGATVNEQGSDGRFLSWTGQVQWIRQMTDAGIQMVFRTDMRLANDSLLPMENFSVGGMNSVRGYRENLLVRDNGVTSSLEFRFPVLHNQKGETVLQFAPFADFGRSWNTDRHTPDPRTISSVGAGLRWAIKQGALFQIYAGHHLRKVKNTDHDLQDDGIHFQLSWQIL